MIVSERVRLYSPLQCPKRVHSCDGNVWTPTTSPVAVAGLLTLRSMTCPGLGSACMLQIRLHRRRLDRALLRKIDTLDRTPLRFPPAQSEFLVSAG